MIVNPIIKVVVFVIMISNDQVKSDRVKYEQNHPIFTNQTILSAVADAQLYKDSKYFVDMVLTVPIEQALSVFENKSVKEFAQTCFTSPQDILKQIRLEDYQEHPQKLAQIKDENLRQFAYDLNRRWESLARQVSLDYRNSSGTCIQSCSTFLQAMNGATIIVPGGRFRQSYYWDTYWIIKGLIVSDMLKTAEKLIDNFITMIDSYGFIPNGFRIYFLNRSQPPFFSLMVKELVEAYRLKGDHERADSLEKKAFLRMIEQHKNLMSTHGTSYTLQSGKQISLNIYNADSTKPRPESYSQDVKEAANITDKKQKERVFKSMNSMAESGWDFSTRWLRDASQLSSSIILDMIPSDLNTLMGLLQSYLSVLASKFGRIDLLNYYQQLLKNRKEYFMEIKQNNRFPDTILGGITSQTNQYPSDYYPFLLFPELKPNLDSFNETVNPVTSQLEGHKYQWDKPNVWAPNSWLFHEIGSHVYSAKIAQEWVSTVYCSWKKSGDIYEKYRYDVLGKTGSQGEYIPQVGFGWTNGLALYYLSLYGNSLKAPDTCE